MNVCLQLTQYLSHDLIREGWLYKTGPRPGSKYKKRWMSLDKRQLFYFARPLVSVKCHSSVQGLPLYATCMQILVVAEVDPSTFSVKDRAPSTSNFDSNQPVCDYACTPMCGDRLRFRLPSLSNAELFTTTIDAFVAVTCLCIYGVRQIKRGHNVYFTVIWL